MSTQVPSFEQAINISLLWCEAWEKGELSDEVLADRVGSLLVTHNGARGFLAVSLSSDCPLIDRLPEPLIVQMRVAGYILVDLIVKNLAMSTAMAIHHQRQSNKIQQSGSERVTSRCIEILRSLEPNSVKERLEGLLKATNGLGDDINFLNKWNYDKEQRQAIAQIIHSVAENH